MYCTSNLNKIPLKKFLGSMVSMTPNILTITITACAWLLLYIIMSKPQRLHSESQALAHTMQSLLSPQISWMLSLPIYLTPLYATTSSAELNNPPSSPPPPISHIHTCPTTPSFSVSINDLLPTRCTYPPNLYS